jgi:AcrR family transcriptional regulator
MRTTVQRSLRRKASGTTSKGLSRAGEILDAAREVFAREGYSRFSMRGIAARLGITLGTVQHYYPTREALFEAMLLHMLEDMQLQADQSTSARAGEGVAEHFREAMRYFTRTVQSPMSQGTFTELKALAMRDPFAAAVMEKIFVRARKSIGRRIRELVPDLSTQELSTRSALVLSQLMGLTYFNAGRKRRRRADLAGLDEAAIETMLAIARGTR